MPHSASQGDLGDVMVAISCVRDKKDLGCVCSGSGLTGRGFP
jgi:hypothetical protein